MQLTMLKAKIHRATITDADLNYQGSITIDPDLLEASGILPHEKVEIYNCHSGARFATYVISGGPGEVCVNGAAARLVQRGDVVIIVAYVGLDADEASRHQPTVVHVDAANRIREPGSDSPGADETSST